MPKLILGLVGRPGSGKGTVADVLREKYGAAYFRFSAVLSDMLDRLQVEKSRDSLIKLSNAVRREFGEDVLSYTIEKQAVQSQEDIVVIDGIRRPEDIVALEPLPMFKLLAIDVDDKIRFERMKHRGEKAGESQMSWETFKAEEQSGAEVTVPLVMERAWRTIKNDDAPEELVEAVHQMMADLGFKPKK